MTVSRISILPAAARDIITRLLLCVLLLGQLVPANLIPHAWSDEARWVALSLCTSHDEPGTNGTSRSNPEDCCSLPCCHPAPAPQNLVLSVQQFLWQSADWPVPAHVSPVQYRAGYGVHPPRAPPVFGII